MGDTPHPRQGLIAQADMAAWLAYPTELGVEPDEIELLRAIEVQTPDGPSDLYVFRFRTSKPHWAAKHGWMVGVAGPYVRSDQPTAQGLGHTFSRLAREDALTLQEHVDDLIGAVARWHSASPAESR